MAKTEVVTLRVSDDVKHQLKKVFGEDATISDMVRGCINNYLDMIAEVEADIATVKIPMEYVLKEEVQELYSFIRNLEDKISNRIIEHGNLEELEGLKGLDGLRILQNTKNTLIRKAYFKDEQEKRNIQYKEIDKLLEKLEATQEVDEQFEIKEKIVGILEEMKVKY